METLRFWCRLTIFLSSFPSGVDFLVSLNSSRLGVLPSSVSQGLPKGVFFSVFTPLKENRDLTVQGTQVV